MRKVGIVTLLLAFSLVLFNCEEDRSINLFTLAQDLEFGETMDSVIKATPDEYPILSRTAYPEAYKYMDDMVSAILKSDKMKYANDFDWELTIIDKDVMNAFAVPGGKIYFYTGLMKYLKDGASLAGVVGHEMAHVDLRHSTSQITKTYGFTTLLAILTGDDKGELVEIASQMASGLASLQFSRENEYDADRYSMYYLSTTKFNPKGISSFFIQLKEDGHTGQTFEFLSTHPSDDKRIAEVESVWNADSYLQEKKKSYQYTYDEVEYAKFISSLPPSIVK